MGNGWRNLHFRERRTKWRYEKAVLDVIAEYNDNTEGARCVLAACHVSNREKFDLLRYIKKNEMDIDVVIDHIAQELTIATEEECLEMIELGAYLQFCETKPAYHGLACKTGSST